MTRHSQLTLKGGREYSWVSVAMAILHMELDKQSCQCITLPRDILKKLKEVYVLYVAYNI